MPSNYLQELSQFLTQDVGRNGAQEATNGRATNGNSAPGEEIAGKSWYYGPIRWDSCWV